MSTFTRRNFFKLFRGGLDLDAHLVEDLSPQCFEKGPCREEPRSTDFRTQVLSQEKRPPQWRDREIIERVYLEPGHRLSSQVYYVGDGLSHSGKAHSDQAREGIERLTRAFSHIPDVDQGIQKIAVAEKSEHYAEAVISVGYHGHAAVDAMFPHQLHFEKYVGYTAFVSHVFKFHVDSKRIYKKLYLTTDDILISTPLLPEGAHLWGLGLEMDQEGQVHELADVYYTMHKSDGSMGVFGIEFRIGYPDQPVKFKSYEYAQAWTFVVPDFEQVRIDIKNGRERFVQEMF